jgi:hypothetical protein
MTTTLPGNSVLPFAAPNDARDLDVASATDGGLSLSDFVYYIVTMAACVLTVYTVCGLALYVAHRFF